MNAHLKNHPKKHVLLAFAILCPFQASLTHAAIQDGRWHAGIGDPTLYGWLTVVIYLAAVICIVRQARIARHSGTNAGFWYFLALFLLFLSMNKQLDLQSWLTQVMKDNAIEHGWYENRGSIQQAFIITLGLGLLIALISLRLFLANAWRSYKIIWVGMMLLCTFILMRAASFHHFDTFIHTDFLGIKNNALLEIGALLLIILGTFFNRQATMAKQTNVS